MPIYRLLQNEAFDPETVEMLGRSFEAALEELRLADRTGPLATSIAERIIEFAKWGERDAARPRQRLFSSLDSDIDDIT